MVITVKRPNKLRAERVGELISQTFYYDGKALSVNLPEQKYYATTTAPPTLDAMLDFARDELGVIAPGSDLIYANAFARLSDKLTSAFIYGEAGGRRRPLPTHSRSATLRSTGRSGSRKAISPGQSRWSSPPNAWPNRRSSPCVLTKWDAGQDSNRCHIQLRAARGIAQDRLHSDNSAIEKIAEEYA